MYDTARPLAIACSLSPGEYARRLREFRQLFGSSLRAVRREPSRLYLSLHGAADREEQIRDLLRRERECCPFFSFAVDVVADSVIVEATVPSGAEGCLDDLERLANRALAGAPA